MGTLLKKLGLLLVMSFSVLAVAELDEDSSNESARKTNTNKKEEGDFVTETKSDGTKVKYKKKTTYDFEGDTIDGLHNKPSGSYISNIKDVKGRSIIRIRENFDAEVLDSARLLK